MTFPGLWTNSCCSHPRHEPDELDSSFSNKFYLGSTIAIDTWLCTGLILELLSTGWWLVVLVVRLERLSLSMLQSAQVRSSSVTCWSFELECEHEQCNQTSKFSCMDHRTSVCVYFIWSGLYINRRQSKISKFSKIFIFVRQIYDLYCNSKI